jgi:hypothetical protein
VSWGWAAGAVAWKEVALMLVDYLSLPENPSLTKNFTSFAAVVSRDESSF